MPAADSQDAIRGGYILGTIFKIVENPVLLLPRCRTTGATTAALHEKEQVSP